ncbi:MAG: class I SAM-dependent methyltransferase [Sphingomonadaceae bacterium]|nr:class I SAM-dependent methyltransferase [Sphingomonadaceae bacterium]
MMDPQADRQRRSRPRIIDTDWMVLRDLSRAVEHFASEHARADSVAVDFGCGNQPYRAIFEQRGLTYRGADLGDAADIAILPDGQIRAPDASADIVLSFQVLEHVRDLDTYLAEAMRLLRPGGQLLLSTHGTWLYHPHPEDHRRWTRTGLIHDLEARGWVVDQCQSIVGPLAWTTLIRLTGYCFALRKLPLLGRPIAAMLAALMNCRAVIEDAVTPHGIKHDNGCVYLLRARPASEAA